jgi:hypothetical protein
MPILQNMYSITLIYLKQKNIYYTVTKDDCKIYLNDECIKNIKTIPSTPNYNYMFSLFQTFQKTKNLDDSQTMLNINIFQL